MLRKLNFLLLTVAISAADAQPKLLNKLAEANQPTDMEFYADEDLSTSITSITDGTMVFYVKTPILRARAGKALEYTAVELEVSWNGTRQVYRDNDDLGMKASQFAKDKEYMVWKVTLDNEQKADLFFQYVEDAENEVINLEFEFSGGRNRGVDFAAGTLELDLTNGKDKYLEYILSKNADYTFEGADAFQDDELKARVITDFENRWDITIHRFAWGERVPYTGDDLKFYRRHTAGMTYIQEDGACYKAGVSVFDVSTTPDGPFVYGNDGSQFNPERIPCDRVKM